MIAILEAIIALVGLLVRAFGLLRLLFVNLMKLIAAYWPKIVALVTAVIPFFIDKLLEKFLNTASDFVDSASQSLNDAPLPPFPTIRTLSSQYYALPDYLLTWLEVFRVSEALSIIAAVFAWRVGSSLASKIFGRF